MLFEEKRAYDVIFVVVYIYVNMSNIIYDLNLFSLSITSRLYPRPQWKLRTAIEAAALPHQEEINAAAVSQLEAAAVLYVAE